MNQRIPHTSPPADSANKPPFKYGIISAFKEAFARRWDYKGRSTRAAFWWLMPWLIPLSVLIFLGTLLSFVNFGVVLTYFGFGAAAVHLILFIGSLPLLYYTTIVILSLSARRLHDIAVAGWTIGGNFILLLLFIPIFILFIQSEYFSTYCEPMSATHITLIVGMITLSIFIGIMTLVNFVRTLRDSQAGSNKWGTSAKHPE